MSARMIEQPWQRWAIRFALFVALAILCIPGLWVVLTAFRPNVEIMARPPVWIPQHPTLDNFRRIFGLLPAEQQGLPVADYFRNSLVISVTSTIIAILVGMMGGYAFARFRFRGKKAMFLGFMLSRTVPGIALSLPLFIVWSRLGLIDTKIGMIVIYLAINIPFTIWLTDGFFRQIPVDLSDAAQIDGCTRWQAFWKIEFPLARSGLASAAIFAFLTSWNEYALAAQITRTTNAKTMPVGLMDFTAQFTVDWAGMSAMAVLIIIPALILTFIVQKHLIAGLTFGGVKG
ncbi:carbohydrate ABC transporter membrane protein 2, CUT1 family [Faunimonas pinastri]|uniref:Maltose/maltodextrin transport system permease protein MalG n=1 Tax=Faunimonas pinastri TaxID=1855383 RepID=A0A1H9PFW8_9HYPH|nr:carbohydrate ABC transporter permease [Faunimonas pinastri]SER46755.1 carbohydrate ABC transporter membrane protein 2, CUT1 family [Faunimonas pinastri]